MGLIEDRYYKRTKTNPEKVAFLRIGSFKLNDEEKDERNLSEYELRNIIDVEKIQEQAQKTEKKEDTKEKKSFIHEKRILTKDDYLFSIRGNPQGYSMLRSFERQYMRLVASHHFVQVRPLPGVDLHMPFIHLLFDLIVEFKLAEKFNVKRDASSQKGEKYGVFNAFRIDDIREMKIRFPGNKEDQVHAYQLFIKNYKKYMEASLSYSKFKDKITKKLIS